MTASTPSTATAPADATLPGIAGTKPDPVTVAVAQSASTSSVTTQGSGTIQILSGPNAGRELSLAKPLTTLGKPGVQVAVIAKRPQGYFITHVEGAQFPVLNGKTLDSQAYQLGDHDIIELASVKMEFFLKP